MKIVKRLSAALTMGVLAVMLVAGPSVAHSPAKQGITVSDAWSRERPASIKMGGAFVAIHNNGPEADMLVAASSPVAEKVEIHNVAEKDGVMKMFEVEGVEIPAGAKIEMKPGGYHIMLMGLKETLEKGKSFPLTLEFAHAGKIEVTVEIKEAGAMGAAGDCEGHGDSDGHSHDHSHDHKDGESAGHTHKH